MLLIPFGRSRVFSPCRPIHNPEKHIRFFLRAFELRSSEIPFCAAAVVLGVSGLMLGKRARLKKTL